MNNYIEIYSVISGSRAYGTSNPLSDTDIRSVAFPAPESMFGLNTFESKVEKDPDKTVYSFNKFISLALQANPNILELLWIDSYSNIIFESEYSRELKKIRSEFLTKRAYRSYLGYAKAQLHKIKVDGNCSPEMNSNRKLSIDVNGYDVKAAMHLYRILAQLEKIELDRNIPMPLEGRDLDLCIEIRNGQMKFDEFKRRVETSLEVIDVLESRSTLPDNPDFNKINEFVIEMNKKFYREYL